jgi:hypothetical protein
MISLKKGVPWMLACSLPANAFNPHMGYFTPARYPSKLLLLHEYTLGPVLFRRDIGLTCILNESKFGSYTFLNAW